MSNKEKKAKENVVENKINDVENQNPTTDANENATVENQTNSDETKPENETQNDENKNDENVNNETDKKEDENADGTKDENENKDEEEKPVETPVEKVEGKIHVKAICNRGSFKKNHEYYVSGKMFELYENLFEVLED